MTERLLRGRVLTFLNEPQSIQDGASHLYIEDGGIWIKDGIIVSVDEFSNINVGEHPVDVIDHRPNLLVPGFIDTHVHFPQVQVIASWGAQLLDWLNDYTFLEESKFATQTHAESIAGVFFDELVRHGTTTAVAFCSVHKVSVDAFFAEAERRSLRMIAGKVLMDRNAPDELCDTPQSAYDDSLSLINHWHGRGRSEYAVTPRFAITSSPAQLEAAQALVRENPTCYLQTHLSENKDEIAYTAQLFPNARDYFDVYQHYGLTGERSLFGHAVHLADREKDAMAETKSVAVFCPTSNLFLGSGLFDADGLRERGVRQAIATDVGGGTSYSMLRTLDEGYKVLQLRGQSLDPLRSFYWATLGNARALGLEEKIGTLNVGTEADIIVLDSRSTPAMAARMETVETRAQELFVLQTMGDDRAISATYVAGNSVKPE